ncbi:alcohol dehydrogenase GroES domain-containing protein [Cercophora newfieldiana]|uniref:Alcohol dehydrogenase GroES domain-containing protein n=1 Tax=Cercophora newfieldiana TaxID=92897 RepID=A0AA39YAK1_9PEZI|nr:alcohol dehydrogenase GroES domain-containing protein [Cercophora newfieldiana]
MTRSYATGTTMKALVYKQVGKVELQERPIPKIQSPSDAVVKLTKTTICGTDLHIRKGDVATCTPGRVLGHEGVGIIDEIGDSVTKFKKGDPVLISCISSCATCEYCRRGMSSHCTTGGWVLGNEIDGTQAEYVRIPHADCSLYAIPEGVDQSALVTLSDIFPTGLECGVINGKVQPGSTVAIIGAGPVGLAALITAQFYSPATIIMLDTDPGRLKVATSLGAHATINSGTGDRDSVIKSVLDLTDGKGCDTIIEAVGIPATFELGQKLLAPGGVLANVGVHGTKVDLFLDELWAKNISITTRLVDAVTTPMLLKMVEAKKLKPDQLITHKFKFDEIEKAYETFGAAQQHGALKVLVEL